MGYVLFFYSSWALLSVRTAEKCLNIEVIGTVCARHLVAVWTLPMLVLLQKYLTEKCSHTIIYFVYVLFAFKWSANIFCLFLLFFAKPETGWKWKISKKILFFFFFWKIIEEKSLHVRHDTETKTTLWYRFRLVRSIELVWFVWTSAFNDIEWKGIVRKNEKKMPLSRH